MIEDEILSLLISKIEDLRSDILRINEKIDNSLERIELRWDRHYSEHRNIWIDVSALKIKAGIWGLLGGSLIVLVGIALEFAKKMFGV
jgi:hypothetical protein